MLIHPSFDPILFQIGPLAVRWYGLMYLLAFGLFLLLARYRIKRDSWRDLEIKEAEDILFFGLWGVVLGGRMGYVLFYQPMILLTDPIKIFYIWEGGMSFHGGLIGVLIAVYIFCRLKDKAFFGITDFIAPLVPLGLGAGRLGNFINGELWGRPTDLPWGMVFPYIDNVPRHPSQLYEFILEGIILFMVLWFFSKKPKHEGSVSGMFLMVYGALRFLVENTRAPDEHLGLLTFGFSMGQWLCVPMIFIGIAIFVFSVKNATIETKYKD